MLDCIREVYIRKNMVGVVGRPWSRFNKPRMLHPTSRFWNVHDVPENFSFGEIEPDWDRMGPYLEQAMQRVPATMNVGAKKLFCGPESFTPDGSPVVGEAPELQNYYVAAGLNSIGILTGGGRSTRRGYLERTSFMDVVLLISTISFSKQHFSLRRREDSRRVDKA